MLLNAQAAPFNSGGGAEWKVLGESHPLRKDQEEAWYLLRLRACGAQRGRGEGVSQGGED